MISAGALLSAKVATQFLEQNGLRVHGFYGSSETGGLCFDRSGVGAMTEGFVGTAMDGVELSVGREGQIKVKSAALCHALCAEDEAYALHDFGTLDAQGGLRLVGRHADIVKIAGYRISLSEIEQALCGLDGVSDAFVTTRETRTGELRCVALYSGEWSVEAVRSALLTVLPESKIPKQMRQVAAIPYNARGKKDREALAEMLEAFKRRR